jgi:excisionase family DNA binding protein
MQTDRLLTLDEVQEILGLSRSTLYLMIKDCHLPVVQMRGCKRVRRADLDNWITARSASQVA